MFSRVIPPGLPGGASPTLKTGNGESRSWVQIPPHPLVFDAFCASSGSSGLASAASGTGGYAACVASSRAAAGSHPSRMFRCSIRLPDSRGMRGGAFTRGQVRITQSQSFSLAARGGISVDRRAVAVEQRRAGDGADAERSA